MKAQRIAAKLTENERRVVLLMDEFEEWVTSGDLHTNHTTLHPLLDLGVIEGRKSPYERWRYRFTPTGVAVAACLASYGDQNAG